MVRARKREFIEDTVLIVGVGKETTQNI